MIFLEYRLKYILEKNKINILLKKKLLQVISEGAFLVVLKFY